MNILNNRMQRITLIAAQGLNREIGQDNKLLWNIPEDMKRFKEMTQGGTVIMGRKTHESIGRALPNRTNIVMTRDQNYKAEGCIIVDSVFKALKKSSNNKNTFVIGGEQIYKEFLPFANVIELTTVNKEYPDADAFFPPIPKYFTLMYGIAPSNEYKFETYERNI